MIVRQTIGRHNKLLMGTALVGAFLSSYARRSYAGSCSFVGFPGTFTCSGAATGADFTQVLAGLPLTVTTNPGFGITTAAGNAFLLGGIGGITFTDASLSTIAAAGEGIRAGNLGGVLSITTTGAVTGAALSGIYAANLGTNLTIAAAAVTGGLNGITAFNNGSGILSITTTGAVTGGAAFGSGILAINSGTDLTLNANANVSGGSYGIFSTNLGSGALSITTTGAVTGTATNSNGIYASNNGTDLTIQAAIVSGSYRGIDARNLGSGALSVTATGAVTATTTGMNTTGIYAYNGTNGTDLTIQAANVSGGADGISGANFGSGALSITTTGLVTGFGTAPYNGGIVGYNSIYGTNLTIAAANVGGGSYGIFGQNFGSGALSITATGTVTGTGAAPSNAGIYAYNTGTDLTIHAAGVNGGYDGIRAFNNGSGALSITTTGPVTAAATATYNGGILTLNAPSGTDLTINAGAVHGGADGISAANFGSGALSITTTGAVTGTGTATSNAGIVAYNAGTNLTIAAADVSGGHRGIYAYNTGSDILSITTTGAVTGANADGIYAHNGINGTDLTIDTADVGGASYGINAFNQGSGALSITTTGLVTGAGTVPFSGGIVAYNTTSGTDLTIAAADVSGANYGIFGTNHGTGALSITATGTVTGTNSYGIVAQNFIIGTEMSITAANVNGGDDGIRAYHNGSGILSITTTGAVMGSGRYGIFTTNGATGTQTLITVGATGSVAGANAGINAVSNAGQPIAITNAGTISNLAATPTTLAISTVDGPTTIANNGLVLGTVALGNLDDSFNNAATATWNTAGGANDFGAGNDVVVNDGMVVAAANAGAAETTTFANLETFLNNASGILTLQDGGTGDAVIFSNNYVGNGGRLLLDTFLAGDGSPSDQLVIDGGTATGSTGMIITNVGGAGAITTGNGILVVDDTTGQTTAPGAFHLAAPAVAGPFEYLLFRGGTGTGASDDWFLRSALQPIPPEPPGPPVPIFRQEVSLYAAMPVMAAIYGRHMIDTLHERMGGDAQLLGRGKEDMPDGMWGRIVGYWGHHDGDPVGIFGRDGPAFDYDFSAIQSGLDLYRNEHQNGQRDNAGLYLAVGRGSADVEHHLLGRTFKGGEDDFDAVSVGGYWTRFGEKNWYLDGVVQGTWYDMDMTANRGLRDGETHGFGFAASLEAGYPFDLGNDWLLEPQAQLVYQNLNIDDFNDGAADVRYSDTDSLAGRIGARVVRDWDVDGDPRRNFTLWGRADLWHEFLGDPTTEFSSATGFIPFTADLGDTWGKLGIGAASQVNDATSLYANVNYETSFDGDADAWEGKVGLKVQW